MTTELEKRFFQTFDIKPKYQDTCTVEEKYWANEELANEYGTFDRYIDIKCGNQENCTTECSCAYQKEIYPQITDRHYLELICCFHNNNSICHCGYCFIDINTLKTHLLKTFIQIMNNDIKDKRKDNLKHQVQAIFEGEE